MYESMLGGNGDGILGLDVERVLSMWSKVQEEEASQLRKVPAAEGVDEVSDTVPSSTAIQIVKALNIEARLDEVILAFEVYEEKYKMPYDESVVAKDRIAKMLGSKGLNEPMVEENMSEEAYALMCEKEDAEEEKQQ